MGKPYELSSGNVFTDLGLPDSEQELAVLCSKRHHNV
jgi:hypothetical protein